MRAEAGPNEAEDRGQKLRQAELDRHTDALLSFAEQVRQDSPDAGVCTLILRSAKSAPARALTQMKDTLVAARRVGLGRTVSPTSFGRRRRAGSLRGVSIVATAGCSIDTHRS